MLGRTKTFGSREDRGWVPPPADAGAALDEQKRSADQDKP